MGHKSIRILIFKIGAVGDIVYTMPIVSRIHETLRQAEITWISGHSTADLLRGHKGIQRLVLVDDKRFFSNRILDRIPEMMNVIGQIDRKYDAILIGHRSELYSIALRPFVLGPIFQLSRMEQSSFFKTNVPVPPLATHESVALQALWQRALQTLRHPNDESGRSSTTTPASVDFSHIEANPGGPENPYIVLHCGGGLNAKTEFQLKKWPYTPPLIRGLVEKTSFNLVLVGTKNEKEDADQVFRNARRMLMNTEFQDAFDRRVMNWVGRSSLRALVDIIRNARLFIGPDSGPLHIADALNIPTIGLYGPTSSISWGILGNKSRALRTDPPCAPCYKDDGVFPDCPHDHVCMKSLDPNRVLEEALSLLNS